MRVRLVVLLIALLAIVAVPSEATASHQTGSVVDQVSSCREPNGLARKLEARTAPAEICGRDLPVPAPTTMLLVVVGLLAGLVPRSRPHAVDHTSERWRSSLAVVRAGAPWRAPPLPV